MAGKQQNDPVKDLLRYAVPGSHVSNSRPTYLRIGTTQKTLPDEVTRRKQLENDALAQDIKLKKQTLDRLFLFLAIETIIIFGFAFGQAVRWFSLDEWSFRLVITATIAQITLMLNIAVKHLFPQKDKSDK